MCVFSPLCVLYNHHAERRGKKRVKLAGGPVIGQFYLLSVENFSNCYFRLVQLYERYILICKLSKRRVKYYIPISSSEYQSLKRKYDWVSYPTPTDMHDVIVPPHPQHALMSAGHATFTKKQKQVKYVTPTVLCISPACI